MATDYDAPRKTDDDDLNEDSLEELKSRRVDKTASSVDVDETEQGEHHGLQRNRQGQPPQSGHELTIGGLF